MRGRPGRAGHAPPPPADAAFTAYATCGLDGYATIIWGGKTDASDRVRILIKAPDNPTFYIASTSSNVNSIDVSKKAEIGVEYTVKATAKHNSDNTDRETTQTTFTCMAILPFTASHTCNADGTATISWNAPAGVVRYTLIPTTDGVAGIAVSTQDTSLTVAAIDGALYHVSIHPVTSGGIFLDSAEVEYTCTATPTPPPTVPPDTTTPDTTTPDRTTRTSGGGGGGSFFFVPSSSPSRTQSEPEPEPEPYQPVLTNGTIPFVKFRAVPLNATHWNGTTTTPFQCDIEPTGHGHINMTGLTYLGMAYHDIRTSNVTHANATDTTPAVYNMTVHAVSTYNMTELGSHGALFHVAANDIVWSIYPDTIPVFRDLFDDTDILAITQYGTVHWAAADGACHRTDGR